MILKPFLLHLKIDVLAFTLFEKSRLGHRESLELDLPPLPIGRILVSSSRWRVDLDTPSSTFDLKSLD